MLKLKTKIMEIAKELNNLKKVKISEIYDLQGNLKDLTESNFAKLKSRIETHGFKYPFYVWIDLKGKKWTLDGHQRKRVIETAFGDVEVPYIEVFAENKTAAKKEILAISSDYGTVTKDGFDEFTAEFEAFDFTEISDSTTFGNWLDVETETTEPAGLDEKYTQTIKSPVYEVKNEKPEITKLFNIEKTNSLIAEIDNSSCDKEIKQFLIFAAQRHTVFNYELIADFYAHSDKETQELMENSALIIIDIKKAIEHGYVKLSEEIKEQYLNDYPDEDNE